MLLCCAHHRDNENAIVQVNGKQCWKKKLSANTGKQLCGSNSNGWFEDRIKITCQAPSLKGKFTVRVYTELNSAANDESFGIDNVVLTKLPDFTSVTANFNNAKDFQGFNYGLWLAWQDLWWLQHQGQVA